MEDDGDLKKRGSDSNSNSNPTSTSTYSTPSSRNSAAIESARRFLYDEDEPTAPSETGLSESSTTTGRGRTNLSGASVYGGYDEGKNHGSFGDQRLNPFKAACLGVFSRACTTVRETPRRRLWMIGGSIVVVLCLIFFLTGDKESDSISQFRKKTRKYASKIVDSGITSEEDLTNTDSPQYKALQWLAKKDKTVSANDQHMLERYALAVLFFSGGGQLTRSSTSAEMWKDDTHWMTSKGYCSWYGVQCGAKGDNYDGNEDITALDLSENRLEGVLPSELIAMTKLVSLDLRGNDLTSTIPWTLSTMKSLNFLFLGKNQLHGPIGSDWDTMTNLRELDLGHNKLAGVIPLGFVNSLENIRKLGLEYNDLVGPLPIDMTGMKHITHFYLQGNRFKGDIPTALTELTSLLDLRLSENEFEGEIPESIASLYKLEILHISDNKMTGTLPFQVFAQTTRLRELGMANNQFVGTLATTLGYLGDLRELSLAGNSLTGRFPIQLTNMVDLTHFSVEDNQLSGSIPDLIHSWLDLRFLNLSSNKFSGPIPSYLGGLHKLSDINLSHNRLNSLVPSELGELKDLTTLRLEHNLFTGSIPDSICALKFDFSLSYVSSDCSKTGSVSCFCCHKCF